MTTNSPVRPIVCFLSRASPKKVTWVAGKAFFYLIQTKDYFLFHYYFTKCYLHHNCNVNLNWNNAQLLYSSAKPLCNVPSSVFWFVNFYFLPFLCRTSIHKWKKNWSCYVHKWIGKKEVSAKISKCLCRNLFIGAAEQIRVVCKDHELHVTLKRCITLSLSF